MCRWKPRWTLVRTVSLALALGLGAGAHADEPPLPPSAHADYVNTLHAIRSVARRCLPAYCFIGGGSGAIISPDGFVITNNHVIQGRASWPLYTPRGKSYVGRVVGRCPETDLALLKIDGAQELEHIPLGDSDRLTPGNQVVAIGNPFALGTIADPQPTVTVGIVSARNINLVGAFDAVMTDTPINPGNSGGPLLNLDGELVGINGQIASRHGVRANTGCGYAISSNQIKRYLDALEHAGAKVVRMGAIIGVALRDGELDAPTLHAVAADSAAAKAGFQAGDVVVSIHGIALHTPVELAGLVHRWPAGTEMAFVVRRGDGEHAVRYALEARPLPFVGVRLDPRKPDQAVVREVIRHSPADKAGLTKGDIIEQAGPAKVNDIRLLPALFRRSSPGAEVELKVRRGKDELTIKLVVGSCDELPGGGGF